MPFGCRQASPSFASAFACLRHTRPRAAHWPAADRGVDAGLWQRMQANHDLWQAKQEFKADPLRVRRVPFAP